VFSWASNWPEDVDACGMRATDAVFSLYSELLSLPPSETVDVIAPVTSSMNQIFFVNLRHEKY
jgi:hypothetical protein